MSYSETITSKSGVDETHREICVAKSPNKHKRLYMKGEPLSEDFVTGVDEGEIQPGGSDVKAFARMLAEKYKWELNDGRKIWTFGCPPDCIPNVIVDQSKGVQFLNEIKDHVTGAFMQATSGGVLADEQMRGIRYNIDDVTLHPDAIHRGAGQIMPCAKKVFYAVQLASSPKFLEPVYLVDITVPQMAIAGVYSTLNKRRGIVDKMEERIGTPLTQIQAFLPVRESFGFTEELRKNTQGQAFPQMKFSHWQAVNGMIEEAK